MVDLIGNSSKRFKAGRRVGPGADIGRGPKSKIDNVSWPKFRGIRVPDGCICEGIGCWQIADPSQARVCDFRVS